MHVWIIIEENLTLAGQESSDNLYSSSIIQVFVDQKLAIHTIDYLRKINENSQTSYSLSRCEVTEKLSSAITEFVSQEKINDQLRHEISNYKEKIADLQRQLDKNPPAPPLQD